MTLSSGLAELRTHDTEDSLRRRVGHAQKIAKETARISSSRTRPAHATGVGFGPQMSTAVLALLAAVAAVIVAGLVAAIVLRSRRASEQRLDEGLLVIGERMDALADELAATVERMREDALRTRLVESLGQALDLDEVLARCAEAAAALHGVAGATVAVVVDGVALSAAAGLASAGGRTVDGAEPSAALRTAAGCGPSGSPTTTPSRAPASRRSGRRSRSRSRTTTGSSAS